MRIGSKLEMERVHFFRARAGPELSTNKNSNGRVRAHFKPMGKLGLFKLLGKNNQNWGLFTASPKSGPGLRARAQARSTSNLISC